jgi:hypothetical protein
MSINSAYVLGALHEIERKEAERNAERQRILLKGAEASVEQMELIKKQNELLEQQLIELRGENTRLSDLYEQTKVEAESSAKDAKHNKIFGWVSFAVGTLIGIAGIVLGIIF